MPSSSKAIGTEQLSPYSQTSLLFKNKQLPFKSCPWSVLTPRLFPGMSERDGQLADLKFMAWTLLTTWSELISTVRYCYLASFNF